MVVVCGLVFGAAGLVGTAAKAGAKNTIEVHIIGKLVGNSPAQPTTEAGGSIGSARASADGVQYIGCQTTIDNNNGLHGECWARAANGSTAACDIWAHAGEFGTLQYIDAIRSIGPQSVVTFTYLGTGPSGTCNSLTVENGSNVRTASP